MDRRDFFRLSAAGVAGLSLEGDLFAAKPSYKRKRSGAEYSVILIGDTHYDKKPDSIYHTDYTDPNPQREANHRREFVRNAKMWEERCPSLMERASKLIDDKTALCIQAGDIIQGDTASVEAHKRMLSDGVDNIKKYIGDIPLVTVAGNHDLRGADDRLAMQAYDEYMPQRLSQELGRQIKGSNFCFNLNDDVYIAMDFTRPDDRLIEKMLKDAKGARYTFILTHGSVIPFDDASDCRWFFHGAKRDDRIRKYFRALFAKQNAVVICGHSHTTEHIDWWGDGGRITQLIVNSVWASEQAGIYQENASVPEDYGKLYAKDKDQALFSEYYDGVKSYTQTSVAGSYKMFVSDNGIWVDVHAGNSAKANHRFQLR